MVLSINFLEQIVAKIYKGNDIHNLQDLQSINRREIMDKISNYLIIELHFIDYEDISESNTLNNNYHIFISESFSSSKQWEEFARHISFILMDKCTGLKSKYVNELNNTTDLLAYEFSAPFFLAKEIRQLADNTISNYNKILLLKNYFLIDYCFATKRFELLECQNKLFL